MDYGTGLLLINLKGCFKSLLGSSRIFTSYLYRSKGYQAVPTNVLVGRGPVDLLLENHHRFRYPAMRVLYLLDEFRKEDKLKKTLRAFARALGQEAKQIPHPQAATMVQLPHARMV